MKLKKIIAVLLCLASAASLGACGKDNGERSEKPKFSMPEAVASAVQVENSAYGLSVDETGNNITLISKTDGTVYSSVTGDELGSDFENQQILKSALVLDYMPQLETYKTVFSADSAACTAVAEKEAENAIRVTYYFGELKISIPVIYSLSEQGYSAAIDLNQIAEGGEYMVGRISLLPLAARAQNGGSGYLLIPSGSGGLAYMSNTEMRAVTAEVAGAVYGEARNNLWTLEKTYLPVYGACEQGSAMFTVIDSGAELAALSTNVNDQKYGSSFSYAVFTVRGSAKVTKGSTTAMESMIYDDDIADTSIKLNFYPLTGEKASYTGMAEQYKGYLASKYGAAEKQAAPLLALKFLGGVEEKKFAFGIPYYSLFSLTSVEEAREITDEIAKETGINPLVQLVGFGDGGLENNKIAGGYKIPSKLGSFKQIAEWQAAAEKLGATVALDFDIVNFKNGSNGFSKSDAAKSAVNKKQEYNYYQVALLDANKMFSSFYRLSRSSLDKAAEKLLKLADKKELNAISLATLDSTAYSDYGNRKYFAKATMSEQTGAIIDSFREKDITVVANAAYDYAAARSDYILDAPIQTSKSDIIDVEIPFYQMVFSDRAGLYNISVNLTMDDNTALLKAAEAGTGLSYTVCKSYSTKLISSSQNSLYATDYAGVKDRIISQAEEYGKLYDQIKDSYISSHRAISNELRETVFANGVKVYVNYGYSELSADGVSVPARSYVIKGGISNG